MSNVTGKQFFASIFIFTLFSGAAQAGESEIGMEGWEFSPAELTIVEGESVVWYNDDDTNHDLAFFTKLENAPTLEKPYKVRSTKRYTLTFNKAGTYNYTCKIHRDYDMKGVIIVKGIEK